MSETLIINLARVNGLKQIPWVPWAGKNKQDNFSSSLQLQGIQAYLLKPSCLWLLLRLCSPSIAPHPDLHQCATDQGGQLINFHKLKICFGEGLDHGSLNPSIASLSAAMLACGRLKYKCNTMGDISLCLPWARGKKWECQVLTPSPPYLISGPK